ncbi:MAG: D-alanyl-D-alanine carboxypeptidase/D-alanyl-D-alanine-endopeptidase [Actinobacteria bacterium]|nr:D-alanyl-D-alanine carboxypeptidase/D-alanyl-D-alanine-endopeptidase [Actinomycetota bacterium]
MARIGEVKMFKDFFFASLRKASDYSTRMPTRRLVASLLIATTIIAIPLLSVWQVALAAGDEVRPLKFQNELPESPKTPLFSARRVPQTLVDLYSAGRVKGKLSQVVRAMPPQSCLTVVTDSKVVIEVNPMMPLVPGSNLKLLTAAVALDVLGPDRRFSTKMLGIVVGSVVRGDLWLVGSGDPLLTTRAYPLTEKYPTINPTDVETLVDALVALGVTKIEGAVIADESIYDRERYVPSWGDGIRSVEAGPLGALMINDGSVTGSPLKPANPAFAAASEFTKLLQSRGIAVRDSPEIGTASIDTPLIATLESAPLNEIVAEMLINSDNNTAELLVKEIGRVARSSATRIDGLNVIASKIAEWGLPGEGVALLDGSGLDRGNLLTCRLLSQLLQRDGQEGLVTNSLATAGATGTLRDVFLTGPGAGTMRAKTGTLNGVKSLSGMFPLDDARSSVFSLIMNGSGTSTLNFYRPIWNNLATALAFGNETLDVNRLVPLK